MEREQFTFYASFLTALRRIRKPAERCAAYDAICVYAITGELPDLDKLPDAAAIAFELIRPVLDSGKRKSDSGRAGGKQTGSKPEANGKQTASEGKPEANPKRGQTARDKEGEGEKEGEKEKENECSVSPPTPSSPKPVTATGLAEEATQGWSQELRQAVMDWLTYKKQKRQGYQEVGLKSLLTQIRKAADEHGDAAVVETIRNSMASGYVGITLDKLSGQKPRSPAYMSAGAQQPLTSRQWDEIIDKI